MTKRLTKYGRPDQMAYSAPISDYNRRNTPVVAWQCGDVRGTRLRAKRERHLNPRPVLRGGRPNLPAWF